jgi:site-specific DNA-methyltransferase (adenine-specific)
MSDTTVSILFGDCMELMQRLPDGIADAVVTDPPYGVTQNEWDSAPDMPRWWAEVRRVCRGTVLMTASQPFASMAIMSNLSEFRHEWIWRKNRGSNFANTVREPFKEHEHVLVFSPGKWVYNPRRESRRGSGASRANYKVSWNPGGSNYRDFAPRGPIDLTDDRVPSSVQEFNTETGLHPTQKPVALFLYMIETYTNPGQTVLDPFMGSGTTAEACIRSGRSFVGMEKHLPYFGTAYDRVMSLERQPALLINHE